jgi:hypothetical protein
MGSTFRYRLYTPSPATVVTNDQAPSGFKLVSATPNANAPVQEVPTLEGTIRVVGLPSVTYQLRYLSLATVNSALTLEYFDHDPPLEFVYFGASVDNAMLTGVGISVQEVAEGRGVLALIVDHTILALGQRAAYT